MWSGETWNWAIAYPYQNNSFEVEGKQTKFNLKTSLPREISVVNDLTFLGRSRSGSWLVFSRRITKLFKVKLWDSVWQRLIHILWMITFLQAICFGQRHRNIDNWIKYSLLVWKFLALILLQLVDTSSKCSCPQQLKYLLGVSVTVSVHQLPVSKIQRNKQWVLLVLFSNMLP